MVTITDEQSFSIELISKRNLGLDLPKGTKESVLIEGSLGHVTSLKFIERAMLEITGTEGVFRMDFNVNRWNRLLRKGEMKND